MNAYQQTFEIASGVWRISEVPSNRWPLVDPPASRFQLADAHLSFAVSSDEEHVQLHLSVGGRTFDMGSRGHNYLLLTLARRRLEDSSRGFADTACGWIVHGDFTHDPMMCPPRLNIDVCRIRKQFAAIGIAAPASIVERRPRARQIRIGARRLSVVRL
jgi:hypothetical protein